MRQLLECPPVPVPHPDGLSRAGECMSIFNFQVVTPLFGGGTAPGSNDEVTPVRGSSIRGHLRFWWRATKGTEFDDASKLRKEETSIWGSASVPSSVSLHVSKVNSGKIFGETDLENNDKYVLFPFFSNGQSGKAKMQITFVLTLSYPESKRDDVMAALWAWTNFGGLGARTRRGCGALFCSDLSPNERFQTSADVQTWYSNMLQKFGIKTAANPKEWPTLPAEIVCKRTESDVLRAWRDAIEVLYQFRQGGGIGRTRRNGRSRWPEADYIRRLTRQSNSRHREPITTIDGFPRAEFGLPIIFHFKDVKSGDPPDSTLKPSQNERGDRSANPGDRMASPVVIKPLAVHGDKALAIVLVLVTQPLVGAVLQVGDAKDQRSTNSRSVGKDHIIKATDIRNPSFAAYENSPMRGRTSTGSAIEAFLHFVRERWSV